MIPPHGAQPSIRQAQSSDAATYVRYMNSVGGESDYLTFGSDDYGRSVEDVERMVELARSRPNHLFLTAWSDNSLVGALTLEGSLRPRLQHAADLGMTVARSHWSEGIGRALLRQAIAWGRESATLSKINLQVRSDHLRAIGLYSSVGFIREGVIARGMFVNDMYHDLVTMGLLT